MKTNFSGTILVSNVWSGAIGGAIFTGKNIENNFNVKCRADYKIITRTPEKGEFWKISGEIIKTKEYGDMIIVKKCNLVALPSVKYLSSLLIKHPVFRKIGLGPSKVNNLLKNIGGEELIRLMNTGNATHIADFIAKPIAEALCERWNPLNNEMQLASFFMDNNIDPYLTKKIIKVCRFNTLERIKKNPYGLLAFGAITKNFWNSIDQTAQKLGFTKDSKERKIGAVEQILYDLLRQGDTAITQSKLENLLIKLLGKKEHCKGAILEASKVKAICFFRRSNVTYVQSVGAATIEANLEKNILNLQSKEFVNNISKTQLNTSIDAYCHKNVIEQGYPITEEQKSAVRMSLTEHISIITGFGGTGKTTVLKAIVDIAEIGNRRVYILALAGKAKERAKEAVKRDNIAFTIHRFIKILQESRDELDLNDPIIIIDEASMVDIVLANRLMSQLKAINFSLVLVGDPAQLSPVGIGLFFHECVNKLPTVHLTKVHRQSDHSKIHQIAMKFRCGEVSKIPSWNNEREGVFFIDSGSTQRELIRTLSHVTTEYKMQIITPHASEYMSDNTRAINDAMQYLHNQQAEGIKLGSRLLNVNDPIIVTLNNYELGLYNGTTGVITDVGSNDGQDYISANFNGLSCDLTKNQCFELGIELSYAITVHKSQGSEYDAIIICCINKSKLLERSMIYTALTRSKKLTLFVGNKEVLNNAIIQPPRAETICHGFTI